jgi:hypothetical protein
MKTRLNFKKVGPSQEAAEAMQTRSALLRERAYEEVVIGGAATADEVAAALGESVLSIRPRFTELLQVGWITDTGIRRPNISGRNATVWAPLSE